MLCPGTQVNNEKIKENQTMCAATILTMAYINTSISRHTFKTKSNVLFQMCNFDFHLHLYVFRFQKAWLELFSTNSHLFKIGILQTYSSKVNKPLRLIHIQVISSEWVTDCNACQRKEAGNKEVTYCLRRMVWLKEFGEYTEPVHNI